MSSSPEGGVPHPSILPVCSGPPLPPQSPGLPQPCVLPPPHGDSSPPPGEQQAEQIPSTPAQTHLPHLGADSDLAPSALMKQKTNVLGKTLGLLLQGTCKSKSGLVFQGEVIHCSPPHLPQRRGDMARLLLTSDQLSSKSTFLETK